MPTTKNDAERAVRLYLLFLEDPGALRDDSEIQRLRRSADGASDPIDKLKALAALEQATTIDEAPLREGFVAHAKSWAEAQGVPVAAFRELKVTDDVLRDAGFSLPTARRRGRRGATGPGRQRAKAVPVDDIKAFILGQKGTFLLSDVMAGAGGSQATVRKALDELISSGQVQKTGPVPDHPGPGRAPLQYKRV
jgi:hypothetical protein